LGIEKTLGQKVRCAAFKVRDELSRSVHSNNRFLGNIGSKETGEKSHAYLEMDVHSRTAGFGERSRAATRGVSTFGAA
jgi:hypothetical protein